MRKDSISVCICTYNRNILLERLLKKLDIQETNGLFTYSIIVIDNDSKGSAKELISRMSHETTYSIQYEIEPETSIPAARNHAIKLARGEYIAIIDDDEFPASSWLLNLHKALNTFDVDGVLGPVFPFFKEKPPSWLVKGAFYERPVYRTGTILEWYQTRTGNVMLHRRVFDEHCLRFDLNYRTSSSDRAFFLEAIKLGYKFIFAEEAPVYEIVPPERWQKSYFLKRSIVQGYSTWHNIKKTGGFFLKTTQFIKSLISLIVYILIFPISLLMGPRFYVKILEKGAYHLSQLLARVGIELIKKRDF